MLVAFKVAALLMFNVNFLNEKFVKNLLFFFKKKIIFEKLYYNFHKFELLI